MRRWNGWGDEQVDYPLPPSATEYLNQHLGAGVAVPDATWETVLETAPACRLPAHPLLNDDPAERARHARGQSLPDWIALRSGRALAFPDSVAFPSDDQDVRNLIDFAAESGATMIPYGGGTSVVGHINPLRDGPPTISLDLSHLDALQAFDERSQLATLGAGVSGPLLEAHLNQLGYTLGHFPQSFEYATLGGWIATRSSGQQSYYYGRIEDLFAGGHVETPQGPLDLPPFPASAAGPDLRHLVLGSEGRLGVITRAIMRVQPQPEVERFFGALFPDWTHGVAALRAMAQHGLALSMLRLSDSLETETTLALAGLQRFPGWVEQILRLAGSGPGRCLLIYGLTGDRRTTDLARRRAGSLIRTHGGRPLGSSPGKLWQRNRFRAPYLRNTLWERGYAIDTLETALPWSQVEPLATTLTQALRQGLADQGEQVLAFAHLSHVYRDGASIYVTYLFRRCEDPEALLERWGRLKKAASRAIVAQGGTISHQHGVGRDHAPYLEAEKGTLGLAALEGARAALDPDRLMMGNLPALSESEQNRPTE